MGIESRNQPYRLNRSRITVNINRKKRNEPKMMQKTKGPSPYPADEIHRPARKRNHQPPDQDPFDDPHRRIDRTQAFQFGFQVAPALAALPRIGRGFRPAPWAL